MAIRLHREATNTPPIFVNNNSESCYSVIDTAFNERHPLQQRRRQHFNFRQSTIKDALAACESLLILMKETAVDQMGQEDITCMMMQSCFLEPTHKAKLGAVKNPTLASFNEIIKIHEAGKKATNFSASANAVKDIGNCCQQQASSNSSRKDQISNTERYRRRKINGNATDAESLIIS